MSQPASADVSRPVPGSDRDDIIILHGARWDDYKRMLEIRGDRPRPRFTYSEGVLEIMSPSRSHESVKSMIGCLVEAWCIENGVEITPYGSWTLENEEAERALEPDECYVLGANEDPERPDLAIEVEWTRGSVQKLGVYAQLGVKEVWIWRHSRIDLFTLIEGSYAPIETSNVLTGIDVEQLGSFVAIKPMTRAVREYRRALRGE